MRHYTIREERNKTNDRLKKVLNKVSHLLILVASGYQIAKVGINQVSNVYKLFDFDRKIYLEFKGKKKKKNPGRRRRPKSCSRYYNHIGLE